MSGSGRVVTLNVESQVLQGNPLGDPTQRRLTIYLPPNYEQEQQHYPSLWVLAGFTGFGESMVQRTAWSESLDQRMDRLIAEGCPPAILVMPDCFTLLGGSQYLNSSATGRYRDHLLEELIPRVDAEFRTVAGPQGRGVLGKSSGGYAALHLSMEFPEIFGVAASHSGDSYFDYSYVPDFPRLLNAIRDAGGVQEFVDRFLAKKKLSGNDILSMNVLAMAAAYSPNPETRPLGIDLPFDLETGERKEEVWQRWKAWDPVEMVARNADNLRRLRLLFVDCGTRDEYHLQWGARIFVQRCREHGIPVEHEEFDDDHRGLSYRYDVSIPKLCKALAAE